MRHPTPDQLAYMSAHESEDRRSWFIAVQALCLGLAFAAVFLRFLSRVKIGTNIGLDDWLICAAAVLMSGHVTCMLVSVKYGMGRHAVHVSDVKSFALVSLIAQCFYNLCIPVIKMSILCLYGRIFRRTTGWFMPILWVTALFVLLYTIPQCFAYVFQCVPIESLWSDLAPGYKVVCIDFKAVIVAFGIINIITDWWILALPVPVVLGLKLELKAKWSICSLFLIGGFVCIISIVRIFFARHVETVDPSWDYVPISTISSIECAAGILAACMPTWRPLFKFVGQGISSYYSNSKRKSNLHYGNNVAIGRGKWSQRGGKDSSSQSKNGAKIDHNGMGTGMLQFKPSSRRSDASLSGASLDKILKGRRDSTSDIELEECKSSKSSPSLQVTSSNSTGRSRSPGLELEFKDPNIKYEAKAGADRWEGLMKQQQLKNDSEERDRGRAASPNGRSYGDVAYGARNVSIESDKEMERRRESHDRDRGLGIEGIAVTKTVTSVTGERK